MLCWLIVIIAGPFFLLYGLLSRKHLASLKQRLGIFRNPQFEKGAFPHLWFHAASVGEVQVAKALIAEAEKLMPRAAFALTTVTEQGYLVARRQLGTKVFCLYAPLELQWVVRRFIRKLKPNAYICLETELWPTMIRTAGQEDIKLLLLNGRLSENSLKNYQRFYQFFNEILSHFNVISTILPHDRDRFAALGVEPEKIVVNGNAKYDLRVPSPEQNVTNRLYKKLDINNRETILIAGSTHSGEEEILLNVFQQLKKQIPDLIMLLAPRHLARGPKIEQLLQAGNCQYQLYSLLEQQQRQHDIVLVDVMGELAQLYSVATYVFCGGSLVQRGGHNVMEAVAWGKPVFFGPSMDDFVDVKNMLLFEKAGFIIEDGAQLADAILYFYNNPSEYRLVSSRAAELALVQQGSASRQATMIANVFNT